MGLIEEGEEEREIELQETWQTQQLLSEEEEEEVARH